MPDAITSERPICFVISPIGDRGSDTRRLSDDLFELIVEPALEKYRYEVLRADKIFESGDINSQIISLIQSAQLCVIDLSDHNPNVYYEAGRRHEAGLPSIQLIRDEQSIPFDLAGLRTIKYDVTDARRIRETQLEIQQYIDQVKDSRRSDASGVSLSSIAATLGKISRRLDSMTVATRSFGSATATERESLAIDLISPETGITQIGRHPREQFIESVAIGDLSGALQAYLRWRPLLDPGSDEFISVPGLLAGAGISEAFTPLFSYLSQGDLSLHDPEALVAGFASIVSFFIYRDEELEGVDEMKLVAERILSEDRLSDRDRAGVENQLQRILFGAHQLEEALEHALAATSLDPEEPAYWYNLSLVYEALDRNDEAAHAIEQVAKLRKPTARDLSQIIEIYYKVGRVDEARSHFDQLKTLDPTKAGLLQYRLKTEGTLPEAGLTGS